MPPMPEQMVRMLLGASDLYSKMATADMVADVLDPDQATIRGIRGTSSEISGGLRVSSEHVPDADERHLHEVLLSRIAGSMPWAQSCPDLGQQFSADSGPRDSHRPLTGEVAW